MAFNQYRTLKPLDLSGIQQYTPNIELLDSLLTGYQKEYDISNASLNKMPNFNEADTATVNAYKAQMKGLRDDMVNSYLKDPRKGSAASREAMLELDRSWQPGGEAYEVQANYNNDQKFREVVQKSNLPPEFADAFYNTNKPKATYDEDGKRVHYNLPLSVPGVPNFSEIALNGAKEVLPTKDQIKDIEYNSDGSVAAYILTNNERRTVEDMKEALTGIMGGHPEVQGALQAYGDKAQTMLDQALEGAFAAKDYDYSTSTITPVKNPKGETVAKAKKTKSDPTAAIIYTGSEITSGQIRYEATKKRSNNEATETYMNYSNPNFGSEVYNNNEVLIKESSNFKYNVLEAIGDDPFARLLSDKFETITEYPTLENNKLELMPRLSDTLIPGTTPYQEVMEMYIDFEAKRRNVDPNEIDEIEAANSVNKDIAKIDAVVEHRNTLLTDKARFDKRSEEEFLKELTPIESKIYLGTASEEDFIKYGREEGFGGRFEHKNHASSYKVDLEKFKSELDELNKKITDTEEGIINKDPKYAYAGGPQGSLKRRKQEKITLESKISKLEKSLLNASDVNPALEKLKPIFLDRIKNKTDRKVINNRVAKEIYPLDMKVQGFSFLHRNNDGSLFAAPSNTLNKENTSKAAVYQHDAMVSLLPSKIKGEDNKDVFQKGVRFDSYEFKNLSGIDGDAGVKLTPEELQNYVGFQTADLITDADGNFHMRGKLQYKDGSLSDGFYTATNNAFSNQLRKEIATSSPMQLLPYINQMVDRLEFGEESNVIDPVVLGNGYSLNMSKDSEGLIRISVLDFDGSTVPGSSFIGLKDPYEAALEVVNLTDVKNVTNFDKELNWKNMVSPYSKEGLTVLNNIDFNNSQIEKAALDRNFAPKVNELFEGFSTPVIATSALRSLTNQSQYESGPQYTSKHLTGNGLDVKLDENLQKEFEQKYKVLIEEDVEFELNGVTILPHRAFNKITGEFEGYHLDIKNN